MHHLSKLDKESKSSREISLVKMDNNAPLEEDSWKRTKEAVASFRQLLLCSKCSNLMEEPVCLGICEHMLCRSCAGPRAGDGCAVCRSPAWVKDIQINRQLSSIIQLFSGLDSLLNPTELPAESSCVEVKSQAEAVVLKQKKNFKIWFSPRSRKVRCKVEKPLEVPIPDNSSSGEQPAAQCQDLSVFNFASSSQDSSSSQCENNVNRKGRKRSKKVATKKQVQGRTSTTRKQNKESMKRKRLETINRQWGITEDQNPSSGLEPFCADGARRSSKRVSFLSPTVANDKPHPEVSQIDELSLTNHTMKEGFSGGGVNVLSNQSQHELSISSEMVSTNDPNPNNNSSKNKSISPQENTSKRNKTEEVNRTLDTTPKRPRASPGQRRKTPDRPSLPFTECLTLTSPMRERSKKHLRADEQRSPSVVALRSAESHNKSLCSPRSSGSRSSPGSPAVMKRNHKGETPLHLAAIKGDVDSVEELLDQGADPNLKDNAGWTPLHEACNLGHLAAVEVLVSRGALLNTPGYENDSPLHDAVRNGHAAIVQLLLQLGASQNVLNLHGKRPADYAVSQEMLQIFQEAAEETQDAKSHTAQSPSATVSASNESIRRDQTLLLLASKLSQPEQHQLASLGVLLGGRIADTFSSSVSHVVVPEGQMPTTYSTLLGLLAGCWVVKYSWVEACLQAGKWLPEAEHEAGEGSRRSRINRCSLLPPLFDGCFFFLHGSFKGLTKDELAKLLREGGGQLLSRQPKPDSDVTQTLNAAAYHAEPGSDQALCTQYIIYDPQGNYKPAVVRRGKVWSAPSTWIIDCISSFSLLPVPQP
ncbi:BRCA1-associated RING domain protein 1 isoform X1 [Cyprinodon tularosa]|uniref:BRCA1-associated RING domain protein 1 isoform X1 n=1 Tax=Cyprinodon tularosa TaxID=77115 RepID=UPI0018E250DC|nr:BRCA1-associated RING domain protein 1 isoform X1 [Cyprinodon tularosa]